MLLNRFWWGGQTDTVNYIVDYNKLIMKMYGSTFYFNKTRLANQIFDPVVSDVLLKIDSLSVRNFKVFRYPSAYLSKKEHSSIYLFANISLAFTTSSAMISVEINNFNGIGEYNIPYNQGKFMLVEGDVVMVFPSDSSITNTISIDQFDEANKYCSGRFSFGIGDQTMELRDGTFIVPIYK